MVINTSNQILLLLLLSICSCGGTPGHIKFYSFNVSRKDVRDELIRVINKEEHTAPLHWNDYEEGKVSGDIFVYFKEKPEELFLISFRELDNEANDKSVLALVGVFKDRYWRFSNDLTSGEERRIENRFEREILTKIKYNYYDGLKN